MIPGKKIPCRLSDEYKKFMPNSKRANLTGMIVGETKDGKCWKILWPGTKTPSTTHKSFVNLLSKL
jgi:hypothetical protein